jgi:hypothetical protein
MPYTSNAAGLYGMPAPHMGDTTGATAGVAPGNAAGAAAAAGGLGGVWGSQGLGSGFYDPSAAAVAAAKRAAWSAGRPQRPQASQPTRVHKPHRCNKCWRELKGERSKHKNGKGDWEQGERCDCNCAKCEKPMQDHDNPCPDPQLQ